MLSDPCNINSFTSDESCSFVNWKKSANEIIDDLFLIIQNIVAGTITVSSNILKDRYLECKIHLSPCFPIVTLHYPLDSGYKLQLNNDYEKLPRSNESDTRFRCDIFCDNIKENSSSRANVKQEIPEVLAVLSNSVENKQKPEKQIISLDGLQDSGVDVNIEQLNSCTESSTNCLINSELFMYESVEREVIEVSPDVDVLTTQAIEFSENCQNTSINEINVKNTEIKAHPDGQLLAKKTHVCSFCQRIFKKKQQWRLHEMTHTGEKPFSCSFCGKSFKLKLKMKQHEMIHTGEKPYLCNYCGKSFRTRQENRLHEMDHTGEKPYPCNYCDKSFKTKHESQMHELVHTGKRAYPCNYCEKSFKTKAEVKRHERIHTGEKPYSCSYCGKSYKTRKEIQLHEMNHRGEKPFSCGYCEMSFKTINEKQRHERIHTGEKPYHCNYCGKGFRRKDDYQLHEMIHTGKKPFPCSVCGKSYRTRRDFQRHQRTHTGEKPFTCSYCSKSFICLDYLQRHERIHTDVKS